MEQGLYLLSTTGEELSLDKTLKKLSSNIRKELVKLAGLPPMYDYEFQPQKVCILNPTFDTLS